MKPGTSPGRMPENVSLNARPIVTAGFANDVEAVNQYAPLIYAPTAKAIAFGCSREHPQMTHSNPNVATNSLKSCAPPLRACCDSEITGRPNIECATTVPLTAPRI